MLDIIQKDSDIGTVTNTANNESYGVVKNNTKKSKSLPLTRFRFCFGGKPEDYVSGKNRTGNITVTYEVRAEPDTFQLDMLRRAVNQEHESNIGTASRTNHGSRKQEHSQVSKMVFETVRSAVDGFDNDELAALVVEAHARNWTSTWSGTVSGTPLEISVTAVPKHSLL